MAKKDAKVAQEQQEVVATQEKPQVTESKKPVKGKLPFKNVPEHIARVSVLLINNAELRRFTAIAIRNYLLQKGIAKPGTVYIKFGARKFTVINNGLVSQYVYTEQFFLNALVAAFPSFAASANKAIENLCQVELEKSTADIVDKSAVEEIVESNKQHIDQQVENLEVED